MCILETKGRNPSLLRLNKLGLVTVRACAYVCVRVRACVRACMRVYYDILVTVALVVQYPARLKKFSPRGKLISVVDTGECPYGMALIQDTDLVVTHPRAREFVFLTAGGTLHVTGRIKDAQELLQFGVLFHGWDSGGCGVQLPGATVH